MYTTADESCWTSSNTDLLLFAAIGMSKDTGRGKRIEEEDRREGKSGGTEEGGVQEKEREGQESG